VGYWTSAELDGDTTIKFYGPSTITASFDSDVRKSTSDAIHVGYFDQSIVLAKDTDYRLTLLPGATSIQAHEMIWYESATREAYPGFINCSKTSRKSAGSWSDDNTATMAIGLLLDQLDDGVSAGGNTIVVSRRTVR
jgi:hypothetical protein